MSTPRYSIDDFAMFEERGRALTVNRVRVSYEHREFNDELPVGVAEILDRDALVRKRFERNPGDHADKSQSGIDASLAGLLATRGVDGAEIEATLRISRARSGVPDGHKAKDYYRRTVERALGTVYTPDDKSIGASTSEDRHSALEENGSRDSDPQADLEPTNENLPQIVLTDRQLDDVLDDVVGALVAANDPPRVFLRSSAPTIIRRDENAAPVAAPLDAPGVVEFLSTVARYYRITAKGRYINAGPTLAIASSGAARLARLEGRLPTLRGITEMPVMLEDGEIVTTPGYDSRCELFYSPAEEFHLPDVPADPSPDQVKAAVSKLREDLLGDFPFENDASQANALALALTPPLREVFGGLTPSFLIDAPAAGTGKGLLADVVSVVATGRAASKMPPPGDRDDAEWRKRVTSVLLQGRSIVVIDNVERPLQSASLASVLTAETWEDRVLGRSEMVRLPNRTLWLVTGNNLRLRGDLPRRCVWIRLNAELARPWMRSAGDFQHPGLVAWTIQHQGELLAAVFTLARAWIRAGRPAPARDLPALGSFEGWRNVIGGIFAVVGINGFLANQLDLYETTDDDTEIWAAIMATLEEVFGNTVFGVADLVREINPKGGEQTDRGRRLAEALPSEVGEAGDRGFHQRLGRALQGKKSTRYPTADNRTLRIEAAGQRAGAKQWKVVADQDASTGEAVSL